MVTRCDREREAKDTDPWDLFVFEQFPSFHARKPLMFSELCACCYYYDYNTIQGTRKRRSISVECHSQENDLRGKRNDSRSIEDYDEEEDDDDNDDQNRRRVSWRERE